MANLSQKGDVYVARFRYRGKEYKRSLRTTDLKEAQIGLKVIEVAIHDVLCGRLKIPTELDPGDFLVSGGKLEAPLMVAPAAKFPATSALIVEYLNTKSATVAPSYYRSQKTHLSHFQKHLGDLTDQPCNQVTQAHVADYLQARLATWEPETVQREKITLLSFYKWVVSRERVPEFPSPVAGLPHFKSATGRPPFRTLEETKEILERGELTDEERLDVWECLYLSPAEIGGLLATVRERSVSFVSFLLHAIPAYTGMRRGEVLRLRWREVDLQRAMITATSRKQSRSNRETNRLIDMHPELQQHLAAWREESKTGQYVLSHPKTLAPLTSDEANRLFWRPMRKTSLCLSGRRSWFKLAFHTYRHSFASNLAARGVDQRVIDEFMGHQTEAMRRRYRHLFPSQKRSAIECFSLRATSSTQVVTTPG